MYGSAFLKKKIGLFLLCLCMLLPSAAFAEVQTYEADGYYIMGDGPEENVRNAKELAKENAKGRAAEMAAVFVGKHVSTKNNQLISKDIETCAASVLQVKNVDFAFEPMGEVIRCHCHIVTDVDDEKVLSKLSNLAELKDAWTQKWNAEEKNADLRRQIENEEEIRARLLKKVYENESVFVALIDELKPIVEAEGYYVMSDSLDEGVFIPVAQERAKIDAMNRVIDIETGLIANQKLPFQLTSGEMRMFVSTVLCINELDFFREKQMSNLHFDFDRIGCHIVCGVDRGGIDGWRRLAFNRGR